MPTDETKKDFYEEFLLRLFTLVSRFYPELEITVGTGGVKFLVVSKEKPQDPIACYVVTKITEQKIAIFFRLLQSVDYSSAADKELDINRWILIQDYLVHKDDKVTITSIIQDTMRVVGEIKYLKATSDVERGITRF